MTTTPRFDTVILRFKNAVKTVSTPLMCLFYARNLSREWSIRKDDRTFFTVFLSSRRLTGSGFHQKGSKEMSNEIITFNFKNNAVRTQSINGAAWFCFADCREALGIKGSLKKGTLAEKGVTICRTLTKGGKQSVTFINEPNLYRLIFRSNKPQAQAFADWVYEEVLPSIRKTGAYAPAGEVSVREHTRALPSGKREIVLSEKAKQEIGGIVKACLGTSGKTSCALDVDVLKNLIREVLREELAGFLLKDGVTATEPFNGNVTADGLPAANWALSIVHGAGALQSIIGQLKDKQTEAAKLLA